MALVTRTLTARLRTLTEINDGPVVGSLSVWVDVDEGEPPPRSNDDDSWIAGLYGPKKFVDGTATFELVPNSRLTPDGTRYKAELFVAKSRRVMTFTMPDNDAALDDLVPRTVRQARGLALSGGGVLLLSDGSRLLV